MYWNMSCFGKSIWATTVLNALEEKIHHALFPSLPFKQEDAALHGYSYKKWRNAWCDRQMILSHMNAGRDVFLTRDANFSNKMTGLPWGLQIMTPSEALRMLG